MGTFPRVPGQRQFVWFLSENEIKVKPNYNHPKIKCVTTTVWLQALAASCKITSPEVLQRLLCLFVCFRIPSPMSLGPRGEFQGLCILPKCSYAVYIRERVGYIAPETTPGCLGSRGFGCENKQTSPNSDTG
jgi:hypothetical protein